MATLTTLLSDCYRRLNYAVTPAADVTARLTAFLNETQEELLSEPGFSRILAGRVEFQSIPGQYAYHLPSAASKVKAVTDPQNQWRLRQMSLDTFRTVLPDPFAQTGTPTAYAIATYMGVARQPTSYGALAVSSNIDRTDVTVRVNVVDNHGTLLQITQTIPVMLPDPTLYFYSVSPPIIPIQRNIVQVLDWAVDPPSTLGTIWLWQVRGDFVSGPVLPADIIQPFLAWIGPTHTSESWPQIFLAVTPADVRTYVVNYDAKVRPLVEPTDASVLPDRFHRLLSAGARCKEYEARGDANRFKAAQLDFERGKAFLRSFISLDSDDVPTPDISGTYGPSVLGSWFPYSPYRTY